MGALDPTASDIGHGQLGLRSGLRTLDTLVRESQSQKHGFAELRGSAPVDSAWSGPVSNVYSTTVDQTFDGRRLDVLSVVTLVGVLTRVETIAEVVAGTFHFDADAAAASTLSVRLSDSSAPASDQTVWMVFGFYYGSTRVVHPTLGPEKLVDAALDVWSTSTALTEWVTTSSGASGESLNRDASVVSEGAYSARLEGTFIPGGFIRVDNDAKSMATVAGELYRITGQYLTAVANPGQVRAAIGARGSGNTDVALDGRSPIVSVPDNTNAHVLASTGGEWQRFTFDVLAPGTTLALRLYALASGATGYGQVWFDGLSIKRNYRFEEYESRLSYSSLPPINEGRRGVFFERWQFGQGAIALMNGDGYFEELFHTFNLVDGTHYTRLGGRFANGGNEILLEDQLVRRWTGKRTKTRAELATVELDDPRRLFGEVLPRRFYNVADFPNLAPGDVDKPRPLVFGTHTHVRGVRIAKDGNGYGLYELRDPVHDVSGGASSGVTTVYGYTTEEAATKADTLSRVQVNGNGGAGAAPGQWAVINDSHIVRVIAGENDLVDFDEGGGALVATVVAGVYKVSGSAVGNLGDKIEKALEAAGAGTYTDSYDESTHKLELIQNTGAAFNLLLTSAAVNRDRSVLPLVGFSGKVDRTGATSYVADDAIFTDADAQEILRFDLNGYLDDSSGTYTGTPGALIQLPGDILYFLLRQVLGVPVEQIDVASVVACRTLSAFRTDFTNSVANPTVVTTYGIPHGLVTGDNVMVVFPFAATESTPSIAGTQAVTVIDNTSFSVPVNVSGAGIGYFLTQPRRLSVFIGDQEGPLEFGEIVQRIEQSSGIELLMDGDRWVLRQRDASTPANATTLGDREVLDNEGWRDEADVYSITRVEFSKDPSTGEGALLSNAVSITRYTATYARLGGRDKMISFRTYLLTTAPLVYYLGMNAATPRRRYLLTVKGACMGMIPGDKLILATSNFFGRTDAATNVLVRILNVEHRPDTYESRIEAAEVLGYPGW